MNNATTSLKVSRLAENIIGSEIIKLAGEVNEKIKQGHTIYNFTIGDFNPSVFPIPTLLTDYIVEAYQKGFTNYPAADGMLELRESVSNLLKQRCDLDFSPSEIVITGGARPAIYTIFKAVVDPSDKVIFPVPSWNNNHYTYLNDAQALTIETQAKNNFMPTIAEIQPFMSEASFLALCSPLNPTGTVFTKVALEGICDLVLEENRSRESSGRKPLYVMYDQIYWPLTFGDVKHYNPVSLRPEMKKYTLFVDGISKSLAATGVRVGWTMGPAFLVNKIKSILTHVGAWAPKAEQMATAKYLSDLTNYDAFLIHMKEELWYRLNGFYTEFSRLEAQGLGISVIEPQGAIYLTVQFNLIGKTCQDGSSLRSNRDVTAFLLEKAGIALVPFYAFGADEESTWYRLSVGTCTREDVTLASQSLEKALRSLS
jgi:aspartate aminotransferase